MGFLLCWLSFLRRNSSPTYDNDWGVEKLIEWEDSANFTDRVSHLRNEGYLGNSNFEDLGFIKTRLDQGQLNDLVGLWLSLRRVGGSLGNDTEYSLSRARTCED